MPIPTTKHEFIDSLIVAYQKLDSEFDSVGSDAENVKSIQGNISCCDVVAYQIGWANLLLGWEEQEKDGSVPDMPATGYKWNQLGELACHFYEQYSDSSLSVLRVEFKQCHNETLAWINSLTKNELFSPHQRTWTGDKWAIVKWIQVNTVAPYKSARTKVRRWKKENKI